VTKKRVYRQSSEISYMDGRQVHDELLSFAKEHGVDLSDIQLDLDYDRDYCRVYFGIYTLETDEEYKQRTSAEAAYSENIKRQKLLQYETLKKELGL